MFARVLWRCWLRVAESTLREAGPTGVSDTVSLYATHTFLVMFMFMYVCSNNPTIATLASVGVLYLRYAK